MSQDTTPKNYRQTLNLPQTNFSIVVKHAESEPIILAWWREIDIYRQALHVNDGQKKYILHDGPPYANGHLHMGHALNKILKDIVTRYKRMTGHQVDFQPGWDCHGLPIEHRMVTEQNIDVTSESFNPRELKKLCRAYAANWIEVQREEFKGLGVIADWEHPYKTMDFLYEADIVRAFGIFVEKGYIERKGKTVPWCASCQTVLATAEIEQKERKDPSIYVLFDVDVASDELKKLTAAVKRTSFVVWTTTPWTLPLNEAVALHPDAAYAVYQKGDQAYIFAADLAGALLEKFELTDAILLGTIHSTKLVGSRVINPVVRTYTVPVITDAAVLLGDGTACLHSAPGCGPEDYLIGLKNNLPITSPINPDGTYMATVREPSLVGKKVTEVVGAVLTLLIERGTLLKKEVIVHSYPHCWRCRNGLIFRATDQWFCNLQKNDLAEKTIAAVNNVNFVPDWGRNRFVGSVGTRTEWCISRQRHWGVPIIALVCQGCCAGYVDQKLVNYVAQFIEQKGIEAWDDITLEQLMRDGAVPQNLACAGCAGTSWRKEQDTLDVWFDSGVSSYAVLKRRNMLPADMYLEGSDQHRGWFQSTLLSAMVLHETPPMKTILTHGYVVDGQRRKMSKSLGNGVAPEDVIAKFGRDVMRLWVAAADCEGDVVISDDVLKTLAEAHRKIRNTARFLLANLYDYQHETDALPYEQLYLVDKFALAKLQDLIVRVRHHYENYQFNLVFQEISTYCVNDLSALYFEFIKDRLYTEKADGKRRRSAQTVVYHILHALTKLIAPIISFTADELWRELTKTTTTSVHLTQMPQADDAFAALWTNNEPVWHMLLEVRKEALRSIERLREQGLVKLGLEARVSFVFDTTSADFITLQKFFDTNVYGQSIQEFLEDWCVVSQVEVTSTTVNHQATQIDWLQIAVEHAHGVKCPRCWKWTMTANVDALCERCEKLV